MPPSQTPMAFFQRAAGYNLQRLTKLYQDTKQSYESNKPVAGASINDDPEVKELRRDFQIQQDRLLAWGMHWADVEAQYGGGGGGEGLGGIGKSSQEQDIDKKIDQAGLGEVVASVMSQIKSLLDESGRLQHPGRFEAGRGGMGVGDVKRKEWTRHEVQTGRLLLARLTECIDLLYSLSESREDDGKGEKSERKLKSEKSSHGLEDDVETALYGRRQRQSAALGNIREHPLHIEFSQIDFHSNHAGDMAEPPPYGAGENMSVGKDRVVGFWREAKKPILIDFLPASCPPHVVGTSDDVFEMHELGEKLKKNQESFYGHLRLLGFTVEAYRCGMVYELPVGRSQQTLQKHRTLISAINATCNQEMARPALEDRFRLAYNILLSVLGYFANGDSHRNIHPINILLIPMDGERPQFSAGAQVNRVDIRQGYLLQSCQDLVSSQQKSETLEAEMYRHPGHDINNPDAIVPAFDIYSVGLILLEIGLWMPLSRMWKSDYDRRIFMARVQRIYSQKLASKMGSKYMRLVQRCLHAPTELFSKSQPHEAATHLLEVAKELRLCLALDEEGMPPSEDIECIELLIIEQMCKTEGIGGPAHPSSLPPLKIPGAYKEEQQTGITQSEFAGIRRKMVPASDPVTEQAQLQRRHSRRERRRSTAPALHKWPEIPISQPDLDIWNTTLMPKLSKILQEALQDSPESSSVSLMKIGNTAENAKTTICVQCHNTARVHDVLRKRFRPKKGWGLVILKGDVRRSGVRRHRKPRRSMGVPGERTFSERKYQEKPSCGASIGAFRDNEHLPPVSFGGTILVDGEPFGMTVHHMLDAPSESEDEDDYSDEEEGLPKRSAATRPSQDNALRQMGASLDLSFMGSDTNFSSPAIDISDEDLEMSDDDQSDASTIRPDYSITDDSGTEFWFLDDGSDSTSSAPDLVDDDDQQSSSSDDEDDAASIGDKPSVLPYSMECDELAVTQPAIDDVEEDFFVGDEDDRDEDHLSSHTFGFIHASSGIRRVMRGQLKHEVDWALIRIDDDRLETTNRLHSTHLRRPVRGQQRKEKALPSLPTLTKVVPSTKLSNLPVACRARSSGFSSGKISPAMCLVKLHGRHTFSYSWTVDSAPPPPAAQLSTSSRSRRNTQSRPRPDLGIPGDSGAWIYSPVTGELAGHVLAYGEKLKQCYIAPMEVLFEDIRARLGASRVELPGALAEAVVAGREFREEAERERRMEEERQDSGICLDQEVEMGLRELRLDERTQAERRVNTNGTSTSKRPQVSVGIVPPMAAVAGAAT